MKELRCGCGNGEGAQQVNPLRQKLKGAAFSPLDHIARHFLGPILTPALQVRFTSHIAETPHTPPGSEVLRREGCCCSKSLGVQQSLYLIGGARRTLAVVQYQVETHG